MNIDQLNNANLADVTLASFKLVDALQNESAGVQPLAVGLLFVALCDANGVTTQRVLEVVSRLRRASDESLNQQHVRAIEAYIKGELA